MRRAPILRGGLLALGLLVLLAGPAAADAPGPTNYRSEVTGIAPPVDGVSARVLGGDSFLQIESDGVQVLVPGYDGEELYLRFEPDGQVFENRNSRTHYQNQARYSVTESTIPASAGADVAPDWELVSTDGSYAWHDHRIHWMSPTTLPGEIDPTRGEEQLAYEWPAPIEVRVDGSPVDISGRLLWYPDASPAPGILAGVLGLAVVVGLGLRDPDRSILTGLTVVALAAIGVSLPAIVGLPAGMTAQPLLIVLPLVGVVVAVAGYSVRGRSSFGVVVAGAGGVPLIVWAVTQIGALTKPILPPDTVPTLLVRVVVGLVLGVGIGAIVTGVRALLSEQPRFAEL